MIDNTAKNDGVKKSGRKAKFYKVRHIRRTSFCRTFKNRLKNDRRDRNQNNKNAQIEFKREQTKTAAPNLSHNMNQITA